MKRSERLMAELKKRGIDAALIHREENMRYLTEGYTGEGCVFIREGEVVIITDFRYVEQAEKQAPRCRVVSTDAKHPEKARVLELTDGYAVKTMAVETDCLSHDAYENLRKHLPFVQLESLGGIPEELAREALRLAAHKLPITTKFIKREAVKEEANTEIGGEEQ